MRVIVALTGVMSSNVAPHAFAIMRATSRQKAFPFLTPPSGLSESPFCSSVGGDGGSRGGLERGNLKN